MNYVNDPMTIIPSSERSSVRKSVVADGTMRFGVFWPYARTIIASKLLAERNPDVLILENHIALAKACEAAGMDFILIAEGYATNSEESARIGFLDPRTHSLLWAVPILLATRRLGVISTIHTTYVHPVHTARFAGHLDCLSGGRWGWNIVHGFRDKEASLFGLDELPEHDSMFDVADEYMDVVRALWSDKPVEHRGKNYKVVGKLAGPRLAGPPLLVNAALSPRGRRFAVKHCDYLFTSVPSEGWDEFWSFMQKERDAAGKPNSPGVLVMGNLLLRNKPGAAKDEYDAIYAAMDQEIQAAWAAQTTDKGKKPPPKSLAFVGTPAEVADQICALYEDIGLRGVLFRMPFWNASEIDEVPELFGLLKKAGVWTPPETRGYSW